MDAPIKQETYALLDIAKEKKGWDAVYTPDFDNRPHKKPTVLLLNDIGVLSFQNISCVIAKPGAGKSAIMEAIVSSVLNPKSDNLGFTTNVDRVIWIDFERTDIDVHESFTRIVRRTGAKKGDDLSKIRMHGFRMVESVEERKKLIIESLKGSKNCLLLLDGAGDLVKDTNNLEMAIELKSWLRMLTGVYQCSVFTSLHPNKGTLTPRGHIGSELMREGETIVAIDIDESGKRIITSDFPMGKTRNSGGINSSFEWDDDKKMMVSVDFVPKLKITLHHPKNIMSEEDIILMLKETNSKPRTAKDTLEQLKAYINLNVKGVKKGDNTIKEFKSYLESENYLVKETDSEDAKRRYLKIHPRFFTDNY